MYYIHNLVNWLTSNSTSDPKEEEEIEELKYLIKLDTEERIKKQQPEDDKKLDRIIEEVSELTLIVNIYKCHIVCKWVNYNISLNVFQSGDILLYTVKITLKEGIRVPLRNLKNTEKIANLSKMMGDMFSEQMGSY